MGVNNNGDSAELQEILRWTGCSVVERVGLNNMLDYTFQTLLKPFETC